MAPRILDIVTRCMWVVNLTPQLLHSQVITEQQVEWATETVRNLQPRDYLESTHNCSVLQPVV